MDPVAQQLLVERAAQAAADAVVIENFRSTVYRSSEHARSSLDAFLQHFGKTKRKINSGTTFLSYGCRGEKCPFRVNFTVSRLDGSWRVTKLVGEHHNPCSGTFQPSSRFLATQMRNVEPSLLRGPIKPIQHYASTHLRVTLAQHQVSRVKSRVLAEIDKWEESFRLIPDFVRQFSELNPQGHAAYIVHEGTRVFRGLAVFPDTARVAAGGFKRVWSLDCAHLRNDWPEGRLMLLVAQDWDACNVVIGAAVVDAETADNYIWFLTEARRVPAIDAVFQDPQKLAIVSDRGLAIESALTTVAPLVKRRHCVRHLIGNLKKHLRDNVGVGLDVAMENGVWRLQEAPTAGEYRNALNTLRQTYPDAVAYLEALDPAKWTSHAAQIPMYNIRTSNMVEQENGAFRDERAAQSPLHVIEDVLKKLAARLVANAERSAKLLQDGDAQALLPTAAALMREQQEESTNYEVIPANRAMHTFYVRRRGLVDDPDARHVTIAHDRSSFACSCRMPYHVQLPCRHVLACVNYRNLGNVEIRPEYTVGTHVQLYDEIVVQIPTWQTLVPSNEVRPPARTKPKRRRGPEPRIPSQQDIPTVGGDVRRRRTAERNCAICHQPGHNRRTCPSNPQNQR